MKSPQSRRKQWPVIPHKLVQFYEAIWDLSKSTEGAGRRAHQATLLHFSAVLVNWKGHRCLKVSKCATHLQEEPEVESRELQAIQPDLCASKDHDK